MKREALLVSYDSSDEEEQVVVSKKRKLPSLSPALVVPVPIDNPALHQGRTRSTPHVEGQWATHIYICVSVNRQSKLYELLTRALRTARAGCPALRDFWSESGLETPKRDIDLHISLSRPIFLRAHQREEFKRAVKTAATSKDAFKASFTSFTTLSNDEQTRTFLVMEVGAGHHQMKELADHFKPTIQAFRQHEYYADPRFHASIAWGLLAHPNQELAAPSSDFPTIEKIPDSLVQDINRDFKEQLSSKVVGWFDVERVSVKIGKDVSSWSMKGGE